MTDREIRIAVAEIAGWKNAGGYWFPPGLPPHANVFGHTLPDYPNDANAVIPLLEKWGEGYGVDYDTRTKQYGVTLCSFETDAHYASDHTFARAACIALLKAHNK